MIAHALGDRPRARIAHAEALARRAGDIRAAARRAEEGHIADQRVAAAALGIPFGAYDQRAAGQPLAHIVVGHAGEREGVVFRQERAERLPAAARTFDGARNVGFGQHRAEGAIDRGEANVRLIGRVGALAQMEVLGLGTIEAMVVRKIRDFGKIDGTAGFDAQ